MWPRKLNPQPLQNMTVVTKSSELASPGSKFLERFQQRKKNFRAMPKDLVTTADRPKFWTSLKLPDRRYNDPVPTPTRARTVKKISRTFFRGTARSEDFFNK
jgi:hypothetical protein